MLCTVTTLMIWSTVSALTTLAILHDALPGNPARGAAGGRLVDITARAISCC